MTVVVIAAELANPLLTTSEKVSVTGDAVAERVGAVKNGLANPESCSATAVPPV